MGSLVSTPGKGYGSGSELVFCYLDSKRISEELLKGTAHPVFEMDEDGNEQETFAKDNRVEPDLVDLMMDDDEFDVTIERMVSLFAGSRIHRNHRGQRHTNHLLTSSCGVLWPGTCKAVAEKRDRRTSYLFPKPRISRMVKRFQVRYPNKDPCHID